MIFSLVICAATLLTLNQSPDSKNYSHDFQSGIAKIQQLRTGHIALQVKIDGHGPYTIGFDTGAPITFISRRVARELNLINDKQLKQNAMLGLGTTYTVQDFEVGTAKAMTIKVIVLDHPIVELISKVEKTPLDGLIGMSFFGNYRTTLDYGQKLITFESNGYVVKDLLGGVMNRMMRDSSKPEVIGVPGQWGMSLANRKVNNSGMVTVSSIVIGGSSDQAGLRRGDNIVSIDKRWVENVDEALEALRSVPANEKVPFVVVRAGRKIQFEIASIPGI